MGGGLMQLVAYGAQDIYLSGNPQITFFKVVYRRHTNFAVESIEQTYNGSAAASSKISVTVSRNGDLLSGVWIANTLPDSVTAALGATDAWANIDNVEVEIGGQVIDKQYGTWMQIWTDLTHPSDKSTLLDNSLKTVANKKNTSYLPLQFWFCRNPGLALPLIALQYHEVKLNITFSATAVTTGSSARLGTVSVWCDYVFLDTDERRRFAQVSHEYLIEQVQYSNKLTLDGTQGQHELRFNHPVKELVWTVDDGGAKMDCDTALLQLNGHDRFKRRDGKYFTTVQRYQHHAGSGDGSATPHVYSFALKPEEHQPSGTCNFSRIDNAVLNLTYPGGTDTLKVYAVNYNVLRIMSGMGGLAYSN
jgi:hypothetical protein